MKKNKKGFTLIELLAVIVILGIIITIVVSNVVKYIGQAKQGSYKDAVGVFVKNVQTQLLANQVSSDTSTLEDCDDGGSTTCKSKYDYDSTNMKITISGTTVTITGQNGFKGVDMSDSKYCPTYKDVKCGDGKAVSAGGNGLDKGVIKFTMQNNGSVE